MSAVRKLDFYTNDIVEVDDSRQVRSIEVIEKKQPLPIRLASMAVALFVSLCLCFMGVIVIKRYAMINQMQIQIFNIKRNIHKNEVMMDELIVKRESFMTIEEVESYATETLGMVKPSDGNKVILNSARYVKLDQSISFKKVRTRTVQKNWLFGGFAELQKTDALAKE